MFQGSFVVAHSSSSKLFQNSFGSFRQPNSIIMLAKIAILCAVVAVAYGGVLAGVASPPASTTLLANVAAPAVVHAPAVAYAAPAVTYAAAPAVTYAAAPAAAVYAAPTVIQHAPKVVHTYEPVEQHGYKIAY